MELWETYLYCPRCGTRNGEKPKPPFQCEACGFARFFNPTCAVAAFVLDPAGRALFIRRACEPSRGRLGFPGGFVDRGETAEAAVRREVLEEVGLELKRLEYLGSWPNRYATPNGIVSVCDFFFVAPAESTRVIAAPEEVSEIVWADPREITGDELAFDSMRAARDAYIARLTTAAAGQSPDRSIGRSGE